ncbi:MAG TPA: phosphatase PAP2 family protein, partial [Solirubrobacteraceae bacterium]
IAWLFWLYDVINNAAPLRLALARRNAVGLLSLERTLGLDFERTLNHWLAGHMTLGSIASYYYFFTHGMVTIVVLVLLWWRNAPLYRRLRTRLVIVNLIAFVVFWRYPLAPPRMFPGRGFVDVIGNSHSLVSWSSTALVDDADQLAAMPSLHIAWALWSAIGLWQLFRRRWIAGLAALYPLTTAFVVLSTGNHYVLDVVAGAATLCLAFALQSAFDRLRARAPVSGGRRAGAAAASASAALDPVALGLTQAAGDYEAAPPPPPLAEPPRSPGRFAHPLRPSSAQEGASEVGEHAAGGVGEPATP